VSPKLKKLIIIAVIVLVVGIGGIFIYSSLQNLSSVVINDFRIVNDDNEIIREMRVELGNIQENKFPINVNISATGASGGYYFYSTNPNVAKVITEENKYYVQYYKGGEATIVAQSNLVGSVNDSIKVKVIENNVYDIKFEKSTSATENIINVFADDELYNYEFNIEGFSQTTKVNSSSLKVLDNYNKKIFKRVAINYENNSLDIIVNSMADDKVIPAQMEQIVIQSIDEDSNGNEVVVKNFIVKTNIEPNAIVDVQLVVSNNPDFDSEFVYIYSNLDQNVLKEQHLIADNERLVDNVYLSKNINTIYVRPRVVYKNGMTNVLTTVIHGDIDKSKIQEIKNDSTYFYDKIIINPDIESCIIEYEIEAAIAGQNISETFKFNFYKSENEIVKTIVGGENVIEIEKLYTYDEQAGVYTYSYFDERFKRLDAIVDKDGNIIGFSDFLEESI